MKNVLLVLDIHVHLHVHVEPNRVVDNEVFVNGSS